jgi:hypothetical protein
MSFNSVPVIVEEVAREPLSSLFVQQLTISALLEKPGGAACGSG